jgi:2-keto-4-pentenoate hydratase/2-oxohepta-3-ene-1,7-dioic acid hydratase in catechol pathway
MSLVANRVVSTPLTRTRVSSASRFTSVSIHGVARYLSTMSQYMTLHPGDVLWMGTDGHSPDLKAGDLVDVEISGIGVLSNRFTA